MCIVQSVQISCMLGFPVGHVIFTVLIRIVVVATINFSLAGVQLLFEGGFY